MKRRHLGSKFEYFQLSPFVYCFFPRGLRASGLDVTLADFRDSQSTSFHQLKETLFNLVLDLYFLFFFVSTTDAFNFNFLILPQPILMIFLIGDAFFSRKYITLLN